MHYHTLIAVTVLNCVMLGMSISDGDAFFTVVFGAFALWCWRDLDHELNKD